MDNQTGSLSCFIPTKRTWMLYINICGFFCSMKSLDMTFQIFLWCIFINIYFSLELWFWHWNNQKSQLENNWIHDYYMLNLTSTHLFLKKFWHTVTRVGTDKMPIAGLSLANSVISSVNGQEVSNQGAFVELMAINSAWQDKMTLWLAIVNLSR